LARIASVKSRLSRLWPKALPQKCDWHGVPKPLALFLKDRLDLVDFVETGTNYGDSAAWAAAHFRRIYSIEASESLWNSARRRHADFGNIDFILGDSRAELAALIPRVSQPLFWLDAHWCLGRTAGIQAQCPLLGELSAIAAAGIAEPVILIDDAHYFLEPPLPPYKWEQWPDLNAVMGALRRCGDLYMVIKNNVIVAVPASARADLVEFWQSPLFPTVWKLMRDRKALK
jgi:hypothetical protein